LTDSNIYDTINRQINGGIMDKFLLSVYCNADSCGQRFLALFSTGEEINLHATTYEDAVCEADMLLEEEVPT